MSASSSASPPSAPADDSEPKPKCRICCACPETRKVRDECVVELGEEQCADKIEAHKVCLRGEGFKV
jgi:cytochrome c oxidase assembly protein subunit 17